MTAGTQLVGMRDIKYKKELQYCKQKNTGSGWCARKLKTSFFETEGQLLWMRSMQGFTAQLSHPNFQELADVNSRIMRRAMTDKSPGVRKAMG